MGVDVYHALAILYRDQSLLARDRSGLVVMRTNTQCVD